MSGQLASLVSTGVLHLSFFLESVGERDTYPMVIRGVVLLTDMAGARGKIV